MRKIAALIISGLLIFGGAFWGDGDYFGLGGFGYLLAFAASIVIIAWAIRADYAQWQAAKALLVLLIIAAIIVAFFELG